MTAAADRWGILTVVVAAVLWGTTGTAATFAPAVGPIAMGAMAMSSGGLLQALRGARGIAAGRFDLARSRGRLVAGAIAVAIYPLAFYGGMRLAGVAIGTVVAIGSAPVFSAVIERVIDGVHLTRRWCLAAALGVAGMAVLCLAYGVGVAGTGRTHHVLAGVGVALVAGLTYALFSWSAASLMQRGLAMRAAMGATFGLGALLLLPVLLATGGVLLASARHMVVALYMALVPMFLGYVCYGQGLSRIRASLATTITLLEPAVAACLGVVVVGERLPVPGWVGIGLILASLVCITGPERILARARARMSE